jgi:hypothetical protein
MTGHQADLSWVVMCVVYQGALLRLKFTLKKYTGSTFATVNIPGRSILSQPIEVFSHSQYLHKKKKGNSLSPLRFSSSFRFLG